MTPWSSLPNRDSLAGMGRRPRSSGKPRAPKGTPTRTNISALQAFFGDETEKPNRMRCFQAGLVETSPDRSTLILTEAGREALAARYTSL